MNPNQTLLTVFDQHFGATNSPVECFSVRSPGRVNLIGEHVDYNEGYVLPMAIPLELRLLLRPREDREVHLYSEDFGELRSFSLDHIQHQSCWIDYVQGVARELAGASVPLHGFEGVLSSTVPVASGLSSSAALEVATALTFLHLADQPLAPAELAVICRQAENNFIGVNCGIMDQMSVAACRAGHALLIDCRSLQFEQVPLHLTGHCLVVTDSNAPRELASSAYNERRAQCETGVARLQKVLPHITALRDVTPQDLKQWGQQLPLLVLQRVQHVVEEIARTEKAVAELKGGNLPAFGRLMNESHASLASLYEVSSPELDWLVDWAQHRPGVLGSRMTGAGFGGCTVTLLESSQAERMVRDLPHAYQAATGRQARCWVCTAVDGASVD